MAILNLIETIQTKLSTLNKRDGQLIVIRDNASLYVDLDGARIYISDWIDVSTDEERLAMLSPLSNKYYYVVETNKIWRYISGSWVLVTSKNYEDLNGKPQIEGVELVGNKTLADFGGKKQIRISWEDYQALSTEEKNDFSVVYYVYDYPENVILASNVVYDNATSGVEATKVQGAIDNLYVTRSLKTYTSLSQLGMSTDNTITEIMTALPIVSEIVFNTAQIVSNLTDGLPNGAEAGALRFTKGGNNARGILTFESYSSNAVYKNRYYNSAFVGWRKLTEENEIDAITSVRNLITYTNVTQLGLTQDNTLDEVFNALSSGSQLVTMINQGKSLGGTLPNTNTAELIVTKGNRERATAVLTQYENGVRRMNHCYAGEWQGWKNIITESV